jgi:hypothetical protein
MSQAASHRRTPLKSLLCGLAVIGGILGVVVCVAAVDYIWRIGDRLNHASDKVFELADASLSAVSDRAVKIQRRAEDARITAQDIRQSVEDWAKKESGEFLAVRLKVAERTERLSAGLKQVDLLFDVSLESLDRAQRAAEMANALGARLDPEDFRPPRDKLAELQNQVRVAIKIAAEVHEHADRLTNGDEPTIRQRILQLAARVVATLTGVDKHLAAVADRLAELRERTAQLKIRSQRYILGGEIALTLLAAWMALGQFMLFRYGWQNRLETK